MISSLHKPFAYLEPQFEKLEKITEKSGMKLAAQETPSARLPTVADS